MAYGDFKDLTWRTGSDKIWRDEPFNIAKKLKYDGYQRGLALMVYKFYDKKTSGSGIENENISNQRPLELATRELAEKSHKPNIRKFEKRKVHSPFIDRGWNFLSLLVARYFLLVSRYFLLVSRYFLLDTRYFLLDARYSLLVARYFLLVAPYFLPSFYGQFPDS